MHSLLFYLCLVGFGGYLPPQDQDSDLQFYSISIFEIALKGDVALPEELEESSEEIAKLLKKDDKILQESIRFSALANRPTSIGFGGMINDVAGIRQVGDKKLRSYVQRPVGTQIRITVTPSGGDLVSVNIAYAAMRIAGVKKEDESSSFEQTQLSTDTQVKLRESHVLLARSEKDRRYIVLKIVPK